MSGNDEKKTTSNVPGTAFSDFLFFLVTLDSSSKCLSSFFSQAKLSSLKALMSLSIPTSQPSWKWYHPPKKYLPMAAQAPPSLQLPASTTPLITEDAPQDNGLQIPMPPVNLPLALQKHHMILHCPLKRRHVVEQGSSTWQNEQLPEWPQMGGLH